ncbi:TadE-like protein [Posidoniimonas corsicana]|uniref:TadE-like protein n=1 Tax=Posidoniimonas corsicana TaxID=1938618 RepID=A0A5C5VFF4_9BACT|nr:TadE family protein [Posidoniimonas corsicana]TWT37384.1 TadE-like protein [Posidoniimonas corsicana]
MARTPGHPRPPRHGAAVAELAICLPLLAMLVLASIEACTMMFLNHSLTIASYEAVRVAINYDSTNADVHDRCTEIITDRAVAGASVNINRANVMTTPKGTPITVTVSAPCDANALLPPWFYGGQTMTASTTMVKE